MTQIKYNEIFDLEIAVHESHIEALDTMLRDNNMRAVWIRSFANPKFIYFTVYNVGLKQCGAIRKLIKDAKITVY